MAPKGKKGKKAQDTSWEDDMDAIAAETTGTPIAAEPAADSPAAEAAGDEAPAEVSKAPLEVDPEEEFGGGGLMGALRKQKKKKGGKAAAEEEKPATPEAAASPAAAAEEEDDDKEELNASGRVMTKKEKEKAKKEREKQRKKEQAAKKKAGGAAPKAAPAAAEGKKDVVVDTPAPAPAKKDEKGKKGKGKVPSAAILALQKQQEALRKQQEEMKRLEEEERLAREEEERLIAEEEKRKEEAKARRKEREREKKEQLKKEGKYLTKAQKEEQARNQLRLKQMMEAGGLKVAALEGDSTDKPKKKPVYDSRKKKRVDPAKLKEQEEAARIEEARKRDEERIAAEKAEKEAAKKKAAEEEAAAASAAAAAAAEETDEDDWEAQLAKEEAAAAAAAKAAEVKDSWDDESEEEDEKPAAQTKPAAATGKAPAKKEESDSEDDDDSDDSDDSEYERLTAARKQAQIRKEEATKRRQAALAEAKKNASADDLRSPICCILGHVDTGKTKLLDKIRQTNVQEGEAGGITQQIGATYFPVDAIKTKTAVVNKDNKLDFKIPGLLIIDTPGHESFTNLRSRGSSLCNIAILVIDIMHGLEPQTKESIRLLRDRKTPFIVALNKIDRLYDWQQVPNNGFQDSFARQKKAVHNEFRDRLQKTKLELAEEGLNSELFYENKNMAKYVSLVPTSAHTGEGIPDLLKLLVTLTQERMAGKLMYISSLEATILEVKAIEGHGTTIDVILSNGILREGDRIVLCGLNGAICTNVRALLTPQPMRELRVKSAYVHHKEVKAALGVKIAANGLEDAIAGSRLLVCGPDDDEEDLEEEVMGDLEALTSKISTTGKGVAVQASTLGSLEALLEFLRTSKIPVSSISIGPVYRRDVMRVVPMLEKHKEFAVMLCFDVKVDKEAQAYADEMGIKLFTADIIYHLFDSFTAYQKDMLAQRRREAADKAVFPCVLRPVQVFNKKDPIVVGVDVIEGSLRIGTPIAAVRTKPDGEKEVIVLGRVTSIRLQETNLTIVKKGHPSVAVKIEGPNQPLYGRHLEEKDILYSHISRVTIDTLKNHFRDEVAKDDWNLIVQLKKVFAIS